MESGALAIASAGSQVNRSALVEQLTPVFTVDAPSSSLDSVGHRRRYNDINVDGHKNEDTFDDGHQNSEQRSRP